MKKITFIAFFFSFLSGCYTDKWNYRKDAIEAKDSRAECFIEMNDGTLTKYGSLKFKLPPMSYGYWSADGNRINIDWSQVKAYQTNDGYFTRVKKSIANRNINQHEVFIADAFAVRVRKGKIELFRVYTTNGKTVSNNQYESKEFFYIKKGKEAEAVPLNETNLKAAILDNKNVLGDFGATYKKGHMKDVLNIIDEYN